MVDVLLRRLHSHCLRRAHQHGSPRHRRMKHTEERPYAAPETAARKLVEIAAATPAVQDGRIYIERVNAQFKALLNGSRGRSEFGDGLRYAIERGWLWMHESGTYLKLMPPGHDLLATK